MIIDEQFQELVKENALRETVFYDTQQQYKNYRELTEEEENLRAVEVAQDEDDDWSDSDDWYPPQAQGTVQPPTKEVAEAVVQQEEVENEQPKLPLEDSAPQATMASLQAPEMQKMILEQQKEIQELKALLEAKDKELQRKQERIVQLETELVNAKKRKLELDENTQAEAETKKKKL